MFDCSCDLDDWGGGFTRTSAPVARKRHRCGECRREILPGEQYYLAVGRYDGGGFWRAKMCLRCLQIANEVLACWYYGEVWALIHERYCREEDDGFCLCGSTPPQTTSDLATS